MLRQTQSSIVFTQQLGRGLRKAAGKDHLIVIDFIGNYANNYLIPIALFGEVASIRTRFARSHHTQEAERFPTSSVNFDKIARERILDSLAKTSLDSMQNLKRTVVELENRLGRLLASWTLRDLRLLTRLLSPQSAVTTRSLLVALKRAEDSPSPMEEALLTFLSAELLNGKRPHELLLLAFPSRR